MKVKKILILDSHSPNTGDIAILQATLVHMRCLFPQAKIVVHCSHPQITSRHLKDGRVELKPYAWPVFKTMEAQPFLDSAVAGSKFAANLIRIFLQKAVGKRFSGSGPLSDYPEADLLVCVGGGYMSWDYGFLRPFCDFFIAKMLGKRIVLYGHSIGPFGGLVNRAICGVALRLPDLIIVREQKSADYLSDLGIWGVHVTADMAFTLPPIKAKPGNGRQMRIVMCPSRPPPLKSAHQKRYLDFIKGLSERLVNELGAEIILHPTTPEDIEFHKSLKPILPRGCRYIEEMGSPSDVAGCLSGCDFVISSRMHLIILGSLSSAPFIGLGWGHKMEGISEMLCDKTCSMPADKLDSGSVDKAIGIIRQGELMRMKIGERQPELKKAANRNAEILRGRLETWGLE
ncbi:MAG: polysaccharide pyruvyl transferase family protein [Candidatus Micrarchaeota archaeon]